MDAAAPRKSRKVSWPADKVSRWPVAKLLPYARNARIHTPAQIAKLAAAIREWGWTVPVLVDAKGTLIAGHGRIEAAHLLGLEDVPTIVARGWTPAQVQAYRLADNKLSEASVWDYERLAQEVSSLLDLGAAVELTGLGADEIETLLAAASNDPPPIPADAPAGRHGEQVQEAYRVIMFHFKDAAAVQSFAERLGQPVQADTRRLWFPPE